MKRILFGSLVSVFALGFLFSKLDLSEFSKIQERWEPIYLIPFVISSAWGIVLFSWRWYLLMEKQVSFRYALLSSFIGVGANMFLPARGGDIFRLYFCKKESSLQYPTLVTALFIEKVLDFSFYIFRRYLCFDVFRNQ
ncbi:Uncharacterized protein GNX_3337 [Leptospira interrogans serovar Canicola]|nr:Uncharacterized protein GNX_3337 [Leptospira interrogans serovar Canicola]